MFYFSQITEGVEDCYRAANALLGDVECDLKAEQMLLNDSEDTRSVSPEAIQFDYATSNFQPKVYIQDLVDINSAADCLIPSSDDDAAECDPITIPERCSKCNKCGGLFSSSYSLKRHMLSFHDKDKPDNA